MKKVLTPEKWEARKKLEDEFIREAKILFQKYDIISCRFVDDKYDFGVYLEWKNGLETSVADIIP